MSKYSNKKALISIMVAMVMVLSAFLVISSGANAQTATGTFTAGVIPSGSGGTVLTPLASPAPYIFIEPGTATFTAGQLVDFYWATGTTVNTIVSGVVGFLYASSTGTISGSFKLTDVPSTPGNYYLVAASEGVISGGVAASSVAFSVVAQSTYPLTFELSLNEVTYSTSITANVGNTVYFEGSGFTSTTAITIYFGTTTLSSSPIPKGGVISGSFTVPADPNGTYPLIAYDGGTSGGDGTATALLSIAPSVTPVISIPEGVMSFSSVTLTGSGFPAKATFAPSTVTSPSNTLTIGGVDAILSGTPSVSSTGGVTFSITGLALPITTTGPQTVVITDQQGVSWSFPAQAYVSSPSGTPKLVVTDLTTGTNSGYVGDSLEITGYNLLASTAFTAYFDGNTITLGTTDSNGFVSTSHTLPPLPGGTYTVYATGSYEYVSAQFTIQPSVMITDSSGGQLNGEYATVGSVVTVNATGLAPLTEYVITDTGLATLGHSTNIAYDSSVYATPTITAGRIAPDEMGFMSDGTGSLTVTYKLDYSAATGTTETVTFAPGTALATTANYLAVGPITISLSASSYAPSTSSGYTTVTFTASGLVPAGQFYTPETTAVYGTMEYYVYLAGSGVTLSTGQNYFTTTTTTATVSFKLPLGILTGLNTLLIESSTSKTLASTSLLVSSAGTGASIYQASGSTIPLAYPGEPLTYYLYDFPANTAVTVIYYTNLGRQTTTVTTDANGAATFVFNVPNAVGGTYQLFFTYGTTTVSGTWEYAIVSAVAFDQAPFADNHYSPATDYYDYYGAYAYPGESITFYAYSLEPNTVYLYALATGTLWTTILTSTKGYFITDQYGNGPLTGLSMMLPVLPAGTYYVLFAPYSSSPSALSESLTVELGGYNVLYSNMNYSMNTVPAFPGQLVNFVIPATSSSSASYYEVNVQLNGTSYETVQAYYSSTLGGIAGSFKMFNGMPGNWYKITLSYAPVTVTTTTVYNVVGGQTTTGTGTLTAGSKGTTTTISGTLTVSPPSGAPSGSFVSQVSSVVAAGATGAGTISGLTWRYVLSGTTAVVNYSFSYNETGSASSYTVTVTYSYSYPVTISYQAIGSFTFLSPPSILMLVSGNGALLTGITPNEMATLQAQISSTITTSMQVPLSELNASVVAINNAVATIKTAFGNMTASLKAINATVNSISNGVATVKTDLGTVQASLSALNATVLGISKGVVMLQTSVGNVQTSLNAINATVISISNGVASLNTAAGKVMVDLAAINATVQSINGNVATIMTSAGQIKASLSALNATLAAVNGNTVTIKTALGTVQASLNAINATVTSTASGVNSLKGSAATIQTSLGTISGTITSVNNGVATIQTQLGTLQTNVSAIKTTAASTASSVASTMSWEIGVLVLVIITLVLVLIVIMQVSRISKQFKPKEEEKKTPEEKKEGQ